mgnify:CR=1 FL=1
MCGRGGLCPSPNAPHYSARQPLWLLTLWDLSGTALQVDADAPINQNPQQQTEETEFIKVRRVPLKDLLSAIAEMESQGMVPFAGLYTLAYGLVLGLRGGRSGSTD